MARIKNPQPGNTYKVICMDDQKPHKEVVFRFINATSGGQFEIEIEGETTTVGSFCDLCKPWACEVHSV